jgi:hypothetical protein
VTLWFQYQSITASLELKSCYNELRKEISVLFEKQQNRWAGKSSLIAYQLQSAFRWKKISDVMENILLSFAIIPMAMEESLADFQLTVLYGDPHNGVALQNSFNERVDFQKRCFKRAKKLDIYSLSRNAQTLFQTMKTEIQHMSAVSYDDGQSNFAQKMEDVATQFQELVQKLKNECFVQSQDQLDYILSYLIPSIDTLNNNLAIEKNGVISRFAKDVLAEDRWIRLISALVRERLANIGALRPRLQYRNDRITVIKLEKYEDKLEVIIDQDLSSAPMEIIGTSLFTEHCFYVKYPFRCGTGKFSKLIEKSKRAAYEVLAIKNQLQNQLVSASIEMELDGNDRNVYNYVNRSFVWLQVQKVDVIEHYTRFMFDFIHYYLNHSTEIIEDYEVKMQRYLAYIRAFEDGLTCYGDLISILSEREKLKFSNEVISFQPQYDTAISLQPVVKYLSGMNSSFQLYIAQTRAWKSIIPTNEFEDGNFTSKYPAAKYRWSIFQKGIDCIKKAIAAEKALEHKAKFTKSDDPLQHWFREEALMHELMGCCFIKTAENLSWGNNLTVNEDADSIDENLDGKQYLHYVKVAKYMESQYKNWFIIDQDFPETRIHKELTKKDLEYELVVSLWYKRYCKIQCFWKYCELHKLVHENETQDADDEEANEEEFGDTSGSENDNGDCIDDEKYPDLNGIDEDESSEYGSVGGIKLKNCDEGNHEDKHNNCSFQGEKSHCEATYALGLAQNILQAIISFWIEPPLKNGFPSPVDNLSSTVNSQFSGQPTYFRLFTEFLDWYETLLQLQALFIDISHVPSELSELYWFESTTFTKNQCLTKSNELITKHMTLLQEVFDLVFGISGPNIRSINFLFTPIQSQNANDLCHHISLANREASEDIANTTELFKKELNDAHHFHRSKVFKPVNLKPTKGLVLCNNAEM